MSHWLDRDGGLVWLFVSVPQKWNASKHYGHIWIWIELWIWIEFWIQSWPDFLLRGYRSLICGATFQTGEDAPTHHFKQRHGGAFWSFYYNYAHRDFLLTQSQPSWLPSWTHCLTLTECYLMCMHFYTCVQSGGNCYVWLRPLLPECLWSVTIRIFSTYFFLN